jgi:hypothetical protein
VNSGAWRCVVRLLVAVGLAASLLGGVAPRVEAQDAAEREILALERASLEGWLRGDPEPLLRTLDPEITYVHVMTEGRLEGAAAVKALVLGYRGRPLYDGYEMLAPRLQGNGDVRVLSYQATFRNGVVTRRWNATQVYRRKDGAWRVLHTHWSAVGPTPAAQ